MAVNPSNVAVKSNWPHSAKKIRLGLLSLCKQCTVEQSNNINRGNKLPEQTATSPELHRTPLIQVLQNNKHFREYMSDCDEVILAPTFRKGDSKWYISTFSARGNRPSKH